MEMAKKSVVKIFTMVKTVRPNDRVPSLDKEGKQNGIIVIIKDGDGKEISRQTILNGQDGRDGGDGKAPCGAATNFK